VRERRRGGLCARYAATIEPPIHTGGVAMRAELINPFIVSLVNTFETMLSCEVVRGTPHLTDHDRGLYEISGAIGLSGRAIGMVVVSLSRSVALQAAAHMLMTPCDELNSDVTDAVGEITNMVAGGAKAQLADYNLSISLPNVFVGEKTELHFPSDVVPITIPFETQWGPLRVDVGLSPVPEAVPV
jgi:chemotaxis protein CheX